ncbi:phosphonate C-P lyase system protein PhnH [Salinicola sp. CPA57]|uniref:phosphonate C-P lyase system protein PhnH n=1 Tax=Salinicola sp. CPA57 TaxID=1949080 RepID=UPI000DA14A94|nr:phosphonate C-P lyase system protein PhnH [Salinicola sp. CPA57]
MNLSWPALDDTVHDSQRLFRQVLGAMSEPGTVHELVVPTPPAQPQKPLLGAALWGALLSLCDLDTTIWIGAELDSPALREALTFHTGARITDDPASADFALLTHGSFDPRTPFAVGSDTYPDRGTTLLVAVERLANAGPWRLSGPGIETTRALDIGDSPGCRALMDRLAANRASFPRGLDMIFGCGAQLAAVPRSTRVDSREVN